jgi:hypothetical protein
MAATPLTADWLKKVFLWGVDLTEDNNLPYPDEFFEHAIKFGKDFFAKKCDVQVPRKTIHEQHDWSAAAKDEFSLLQLRVVPVREIVGVTLKYGQKDIWRIPHDWIVYDEDEPEQVQIVPTTGAYPMSVAELAFSQHVVLSKYQRFPRYYEVEYEAGLDDEDFSADELDVIGKWAAIQILNTAGDLIAGAGIASLSVGLDGVSTSKSTTSSATNAGYGARIIQWQKEIAHEVAVIRSRYHGLNMMVV